MEHAYSIKIVRQDLNEVTSRTSPYMDTDHSIGILEIEGLAGQYVFDVRKRYISSSAPFPEYIDVDDKNYSFDIIVTNLDRETLRKVGITVDLTLLIAKHKELVAIYKAAEKEREALKRSILWDKFPIHAALKELGMGSLNWTKEQFINSDHSPSAPGISITTKYTDSNAKSYEFEFTIEQQKKGYKLNRRYGSQPFLFQKIDNMRKKIEELTQQEVNIIERKIKEGKEAEEKRQEKQQELGYEVINVQKWYSGSGHGRFASKGHYYDSPVCVLSHTAVKNPNYDSMDHTGKTVTFSKDSDGKFTLSSVTASFTAETFKKILDIIATEGNDVHLSSDTFKPRVQE
jgi:hypothetical protein